MLGGLLEHLGDQLRDDDRWQYQRFDQAAVALCVLAPAIMWIAEAVNDPEVMWPRFSISTYHDLLPAGAFFIPLTVAVVLFIVNGWLIQGHRVHVIMGLYLLGVLIFDEKDATLPLHYLFAGYFFFVGAFLDAARHNSPDDWSPRKWVLMAPILPGFLLVRHHHDMRRLWKPALAIVLPFPALWFVGVIWPWMGERWLFFGEWLSLTALVGQYLLDAMSHAKHRGAT